MKKTCWFGLFGMLLLTGCASRYANMENIEQEKINRTKIDFSKTKDQVTEYIRRYIPDVNDQQLLGWEKEKSLECMIFDGQKMYFNNAAPNLFRINKEAIAIKQAEDGVELDGKDKVNLVHIPQVVSEAKLNHQTILHPVRMHLKYTLTVKPDAVPEGKIIRCWLPFPRTDQTRQTDVKLLSTSESKYQLAPAKYKHSTLYMEKKQEKGKPTIFTAEYEYTSNAEWHKLSPEDIKPYKKDTPLYKEYTSEREQHVRFTPRIKELAHQIVGDEQNPFLKVKKIYEWINQFPCARSLRSNSER